MSHPNDSNRLEATSGCFQRLRNELWARIRPQGKNNNYLVNSVTLRSFSLGEVALFLGVSGSYLRQLSIDGLGPTPQLGTAGRRSYTLRQINELRAYLASARPKEALKFWPRRRMGEKLQTILIAGNHEGTTTSFYLAQGLAIKGFRVLAIDLDPLGSLSEMFGYLPIMAPDNSSMYAAIRYDRLQTSIRSVIKPTHFDGLDLVPGSSELDEFENESSRRYFNESLGCPDVSFRIVSALKEVEGDYDVVVVHWVPENIFLAAGALEAATGVLVAVRPRAPSIVLLTMVLNKFSHLESLIKKAGRSAKHDFIKFLVTEHDPRDVSAQEEVTMLRESLADHLLSATVWESEAIRLAWKKGRSLYELSSGAVGRSAYEKAIETLNSANAEIMDTICAVWGRAPLYVSQASQSSTAGKASAHSRGT